MNIENLDSLIEKCKHNDRASQEMLYRYYFPIMYSVIKKMTQDEDDRISIINDGFLKVFKYIGTYNSSLGVFDGWLYTVVVNAAYDHFKKCKSNLKFSEIEVVEEVSDNSHLFVIGRDEIQHLLLMLPPTTRNVLSMSVDGYGHKEIAGHLGISEISSRWHLSEARKRVREILHSKKNWYEKKL